MRLSSKIAHVGLCTDEKTGAISTPICQTAIFRHPGLGQSTGYDYTRSQNPTREALEKAVAWKNTTAISFPKCWAASN